MWMICACGASIGLFFAAGLRGADSGKFLRVDDDLGVQAAAAGSESIPPEYPLPASADQETSLVRRAFAPDCGVHCLYVFLALHGMGVRHETVEQALPISDRGASMLQLRDVSHSLGLPCSVVEVSSARCRDLPRPWIARMRAVPEVQSPDGHYVVYCDTDPDMDVIVDGTTGEIVHVRRDVFDRQFTGFALSVAPLAWSGARVLGLLAGGLGVVLASLLVLRPRH